ncbi:hypothetical protein GGI23_002762 [Coemansia sp. RSA 2559]|nr:hypothetical protein GGI23_002762 [Coemansia sp. RSA 2559]KAJ2847358.1 hypothetical protein GGI22_006000 [Coemansia erecta]
MSLPGKYSLWLCPSGDSNSQVLLNEIITECSKPLGAPHFHPHITLFSPVFANSDSDALTQVREYIVKLHSELDKDALSAGIPFRASKVAIGGKYYQCVLLEEQGSAVLAQANAIARQHWNANNQPDFYPHASLVYGDYSKSKRKQIAADVIAMLPGDIEQLSFFTSEIRVVQTEGPCEQWRDIGSIHIFS